MLALPWPILFLEFFVREASFAPYGFNISQCQDDGTIFTSFPRPTVTIKIAAGETACFLCRREAFLFGYDEAHDDYQPNLNLVMFVKNYGWHETVHLVSPDQARRYNSSALCKESFVLRDFRKSRLKYQLG